MKLKPARLAPAMIAIFVIALACAVRLAEIDFFERLERMTYDLRVRQALHFTAPAATNLGFIYIDDASIDFIRTNRTLGYRFGLYWPRQVYGRLIEELAAQNARAVALDVLFPDLREDHPPVRMMDNQLIESDVFFAMQMQRAGNVILAATADVMPPPLFRTNAAAIADITADKTGGQLASRDWDGVLRRARAFRMHRVWHRAFRQVEASGYGIDLHNARIEPGQILLPRSNGEIIPVALDTNGTFALADFGGDQPPNVPPRARPFTEDRIWHMGITLAAMHLGLDLDGAEVDLRGGRIRLRNSDGLERVIPVDNEGYFYIDWSLPPNDPRLTQESMQSLLAQDSLRLAGEQAAVTNRWRGKLAVVGSSASGNDLTDRGATPLESDTLLASEHWNIANSVITGRFIRRSSRATDLILLVVMGLLAAWLTWQLRAVAAFVLVTLCAVSYVALGSYLYVQHRYWLPLVLPVLLALTMTHLCLVTWRRVFEQAERRRVKSIFSRIVSPNIVNVLLQAERLSLGGARREVTVLFADVREFTEFTDITQERAAAYVAEHGLAGASAENYFDEQARETLSTVNSYLALVADMVKKHDGTLDKYIGDCVMAFWGAPTPNPRHAAACVRAAIDAQRAVFQLNLQRAAENQRRELENRARASTGLTPRPLLPILLLGTGINTGMATVGLMGSEAHISNYTVFGREVNLASRLEGLSGRGRILVSEATCERLKRDAPGLEALCVAQPDANVKGIRSAVKVYELVWKQADGSVPEEVAGSAGSGGVME